LIEKRIHIVAFDVPYPADYGGVIDIYFRIKALHELGFKITLHCFEYGRGEQSHLNNITEKVFYYKRQKSILDTVSKRPFIVESRKSTLLLNRLLEDTEPILFEGIHATWYLENKTIQNRITYVRTHNIEQDYYTALAKNASGFKKIYYLSEAKKLKKYEPILKNATHILSISDADVFYFKRYSKNTVLLPASLPEIHSTTFKLTSEFTLFTGNLSVNENEQAVRSIISTIWKKDKNLMPLKIAGKNPSDSLKHFIEENGVELIANPSNDEMEKVLSKARVHLLVTEQTTGVKLKLLAALQTSGHILVNPMMVEGTNLTEVCTVCFSTEEFISNLKKFHTNELNINKFNERQQFLKANFDTVINCNKVIKP